MNDMSDPFYRHSGQFGSFGILMMLGFGSIAGVVVGAIYGALIYWIPFVYLNFLGTMFLGFTAGWVVYRGAIVGKVRNPMLCALSGVTAGCVALWGAWVAWIYVLSADADVGVLILSPSDLWRAMAAIGSEGVWSIGRHSSEPVRGTVLYIVWIIEALIVVGGAAVVGYIIVLGKPFCERCNSWVSNKIKLPELAPPKDEHALDDLAIGDISGILALRRGREEGMHIEVELRGCRTCDEMYLVAISLIVTSTDKKGKEETNTTYLISNLRLSAADYQALREFKGVAEAPAVEVAQ